MKIIDVKPMRCEIASEGLLRIEKVAGGIGVILFSPSSKLAAGIHVMRGEATSDAGSDPANPAYFADNGIAFMLEQLKQKGAMPPISVAVAGGASMLGGKTGSKLSDIVKEILTKTNLTVKVDETGGTKIRSMFLYLDEKKIKIT